MCALEIRRTHPDAKLDRPARAGDERPAIDREIARDEREQIAGLGEGIVPLRPVPPVARIALRDRIAVREQYRVARLVRGHPHAVAAEHVGPVGEEGDTAEAFRLALGAEIAARGVEPHQLGVAVGCDLDLGLDDMR